MTVLFALLALAQPPEELLAEGRRWLEAGNPAAAARVFERLTDAAPSDARSHYYLGVALLAAERPQAALEALERAEALDPDEPGPALAHALGTARIRLGDPEGAIRALEPAARRHPQAVALLLQLGHAHYFGLDGARARDVLLRARRLAPQNPAVHFHLGLAEAALGLLAEAASSFTEAVRLQPGDPEARTALARVRAQQGRLDEAEAVYREALTLAPDSPAALTGIGALRLQQGDPEAARVRFEAALETDPRHRQALYNLATALAALGLDEEATRVRERFAEVAAEGDPVHRPTRTRRR